MYTAVASRKCRVKHYFIVYTRGNYYVSVTSSATTHEALPQAVLVDALISSTVGGLSVAASIDTPNPLCTTSVAAFGPRNRRQTIKVDSELDNIRRVRRGEFIRN